MHRARGPRRTAGTGHPGRTTPTPRTPAPETARRQPLPAALELPTAPQYRRGEVATILAGQPPAGAASTLCPPSLLFPRSSPPTGPAVFVGVPPAPLRLAPTSP